MGVYERLTICTASAGPQSKRADLAVALGLHLDVLAGRQSERVVRPRQRELVEVDVGALLDLLRELEVLPLAGERLLRFGCPDSDAIGPIQHTRGCLMYQLR